MGRVAYLRAFLKVIPSHSMFHRTLLDMPDTLTSFCSTPPQTTPNLLLTGIRRTPCATPPAGTLSGHLAESSPHTGYEPKSCIDVSSEHTPINHPSWTNGLNIENDLTTTVAASEKPDGFHQQAVASGSPQPVPASVVNAWLRADMWSGTVKLVPSGRRVDPPTHTMKPAPLHSTHIHHDADQHHQENLEPRTHTRRSGQRRVRLGTSLGHLVLSQRRPVGGARAAAQKSSLRATTEDCGSACATLDREEVKCETQRRCPCLWEDWGFAMRCTCWCLRAGPAGRTAWA